MPINFDRAEKIGSSSTEMSEPIRKICYFEVLNVNKVPFEGVSVVQKGYYECPFCRKYALKQIIDWRCLECGSKLIKWRCYNDEKEQEHENYNHYITSFYENVEWWKNKQKQKKRKDE